MFTKSSRRGAARVSAVWTIVAFVLFFVALGFGYIASQDAAVARRDEQKATQEKNESVAQFTAALNDTSRVSSVLGFRGDSQVSNQEVALEKLNDIKGVIPDTKDVTTYEALLPLVRSAYTAELAKNASQATRIAELEEQVARMRTEFADGQRTKDTQISTLGTEVEDARRNARTEIESLEKTKDTLTKERNRLDEEVKRGQQAIAEVERSLADAKAVYQSYVRNKTREINDMRRAAERPDGEVTAVSLALNRVWIDLGLGDRLSQGTVFQVTGNDRSDVKGMIEVVKVEPDRAECRIVSMVDSYDPIVVSHNIWNDLYQAKGRRYAVLAGRFDGAWNEKELRTLLGDIGIVVQDKIDINTDFLIAGSARAVENEEGEQEIVEVADTPVYKDAIAAGLTIISIRDVEQYFRR